LHPSTHVAGNNGDSFINLWPFWYFPHALSGNDLHGSLFKPSLQLFPDGVGLIYTSNSAIGAVAMSAIAKLISPAAALNTWLLLHLWLGGWFFSRFCKVLGADGAGAFLGGVGYMCSPFVAVHLPGHYTLVQIAYTAGAMWGLAALIKCTVSEREAGWKRWVGPAVGLGVSTWGVTATDFYLATMTLILLLPAVIAHFMVCYGWRNIFRNASFWKGFSTAVIITVIMLLPWVQFMLAARSDHDYAPFSVEGYGSLVARWSRLVNLPKYHPLWGPLLYIYDGGSISQFNEYAYLGVVAFFIAGIAFVVCSNRRRMIIWVFAFLLALGFSGANSYTPIPEWPGTPLAFGKWWPRSFPFSDFRVPGRWQFALCTIVAVGLALGSDSLLNRIGQRRSRTGLWAGIFGLLLFDLVRAPMPVVEAIALKSGLDGTPSGTALDVPVGIKGGQGYNLGEFDDATLMRQMSHGRPVLSAYVSRLPVDIVKERHADPELVEFLRVQVDGELTSVSERLDWDGFLRRYDIKAVRIPKDYWTSEGLHLLATKMNPDWKWTDDGEALIGR